MRRKIYVILLLIMSLNHFVTIEQIVLNKNGYWKCFINNQGYIYLYKIEGDALIKLKKLFLNNQRYIDSIHNQFFDSAINIFNNWHCDLTKMFDVLSIHVLFFLNSVSTYWRKQLIPKDI